MIAVLTNSLGYLLSSNQVIYPNAFVGVNADLRYTYTKAGCEQDIIIRSQIEAYGGVVVKTQGDSFMVAFVRAIDAVQFGVAIQTALYNADWGTQAFDDIYKAKEQEARDAVISKPDVLFRHIKKERVSD